VTPSSDISAAIVELEVMLDRAHWAAGFGTRVDLVPLTSRIDRLCRTVATLPRTEVERFAPGLRSLADSLRSLATTFKPGPSAASVH
jgi:hypothetical protein